MKTLILIIALSGLVGCNAEKWGYKTNPDYVLSEAYQAIKTSNMMKWMSITTGYPNCKYGSEAALKHLNREILSPADFNKLKVKQVSEQNLTEPDYIKFWIYSTKSYQAKLVEKYNGRTLATLSITCFYGSDKNDPKLVGKSSLLLPQKYCALDKIEITSDREFPDNNDCFE